MTPEKNASNFAGDEYRLEGSVLTVSGDVRTAFGEHFDTWTANLLDLEANPVTLKLVDMGALGSVHLARLMRLAKHASDRGKRLAIEMPERVGLFSRRASQA